MMGGWIIIFITTSNREEAEKIARKLVEDKLVACINIVDKIHSIYWWRGKVEESGESLIIGKTKVEKLDEIISAVKNLHSYEVPEIIAIPIIAGFEKYLEWLDESISK